MDVSREQAIAAMFGMTDSAEKIASAVASHIVRHPEMGETDRYLFESCITAITGLVRTTKMTFENALATEDSLNALLEKIQKYTDE